MAGIVEKRGIPTLHIPANADPVLETGHGAGSPGVNAARNPVHWVAASRKPALPLLVKDANTTVQSISTALDSGSNLVPVHVPATIVGGIAVPASAGTPLPVVNTATGPALDGSSSIAAGGAAQTLFGGAVPGGGYLVANNSSAMLYVCDVGVASAGGASIPIAPGTIFATPSGYQPPGAVSLYGGTTGQVFAARRW